MCPMKILDDCVQQPGLNISITVTLDDIVGIAEPLVTKPGMAIHHYKPECCVQKMGRYLQGQGHNNWIRAHIIKS